MDHRARSLRFMFAATLREVVDKTEGALASLLMDFEGIPVESYKKDSSLFDIDIVGAEFSVIVKSVQRAVESLDAGTTKEFAVQADKVITIVRLLNKDYFVALTMKPEANIGKGRYMLRLAEPKLLGEL